MEFVPNSRAQLAWMRSRAPKVLFSSAYGKGKTRALCEKADLLCRMWPGSRVVVGRKTLASMWDTTIDVLETEVMDSALRSRWARHALGGPKLYYPNGSIMDFRGLEDELRAKSGQFTAAFIDQGEELTQSQASGIAGRLRQRGAPWRQFGMTVNPEGRSHWIFKEYRPDKGSRMIVSEADIRLPGGELVPKGATLAEVIVSGPRDNMENLPYDYQLWLAAQTGRFKMRYVDGLWVSFEGQVYDNWLDDLHIIDRPRAWRERWGGFPPPHWPRFRAIDFGYKNPFVCQWWAKHPFKMRFVMYREIYMSHRRVREHARQIKRLERIELEALQRCALDRAGVDELDDVVRNLKHLEMRYSVADHDAEGRAELDAAGIWTDNAQKDVENGIQTVHGLLGVDEERRPRLMFIGDATVEQDEVLADQEKPTSSAAEFPGYHYRVLKEGIAAREEPEKVDDHGCDTARMLFETMNGEGDLWRETDAA